MAHHVPPMEIEKEPQPVEVKHMTNPTAPWSAEAQEISTTVDGVQVRGVITHRSGSDIDVRITSPYQNISRGLHIPYFARKVHSFIGSRGDEAAVHLLRGIYEIAGFIAVNHPGLSDEFARLNADIDQMKSEIDELNDRKANLRAALKHGELDARIYETELSRIRRLFRECKNMISRRIGDFFESHFPMPVPEGTREDVIAIMEGRADLMPGIDASSPGADAEREDHQHL